VVSKSRLHELVERLPESEVATAERVIEALCLSAPDLDNDPVLHMLYNAPMDDEPVTDDDLAAIQRSRDQYRNGQGNWLDASLQRNDP